MSISTDCVSENVTITVRSMSGDVVWGPEVLTTTTLIGDLRSFVAKAWGKPDISLKFLYAEKELSPNDALSSVGFVGSSPILYCVCNGKVAIAESVFQTFSEAFNTINPKDPAHDVAPIAEAEMSSELQEISAKAGLEELPDEVCAWVQVFLSSGKAFVDLEDNFVVSAKDLCTPANPNSIGPAPGGLLYINVFVENDSTLFHIVDAGGQLASIYNHGAPGGVWSAETYVHAFLHDDVWEDTGDMSADWWRDIKDGKYPEITVVKEPKLISPNITTFFRSWVASGGAPGGRRVAVPESFALVSTPPGWSL